MPMITLPRATDPAAYFTQTNNVVEAVIRKARAALGQDRGWLETCGPTSAVNILAAMGKPLDLMTPGGWKPQPEDLLAAWLNDPRNSAAMRAKRPDIDPDALFGNEVPQFYELAVPAVFGVPASFVAGLITFGDVFNAINSHRGVLVTLKDPGHYVALVGVDALAGTVLYHDPWPNNPWPVTLRGKPGNGRTLSWTEFSANLKPQRVEIG